MNRRKFVGLASAAAIAGAVGTVEIFAEAPAPLKPMELGLLTVPFSDPEKHIRTVRDLVFTNCFLSLDDYIGKFTPAVVSQYRDLLAKYSITVTTVEVVGPGVRQWDFVHGPATIGVVPTATRAARIDALKQVSDFAKQLGVNQVQTHCGFIPENPDDSLYAGTVEAIREVARHCNNNGQLFLMETGQETPTTMARAIRDVAMPNIGVGLDTANLILYGKANPSDAVDILGPHIRSVHAKDGRWPTDPNELGEEVLIGKGLVNFHDVFLKLHRLGYKGALTIERETSGPQQVEDVRQEKNYLERILREVTA